MPQKSQDVNFSSFKRIATGFIVLAIILLIFIVYFSFSQATITLTVDDEPKEMTFEVTAADYDSSAVADLSGRVLSKEMEISQDFTVNKFREEPGVATGQIKVINNHSRSQTLIRTTRFLSDEGVLFRLVNTIQVPAGGELLANVYSDEKGAVNNIGPSKFTIPGLSTALQEKIYGISEKPMTGGVAKIGVLTQEDIDQSQEDFLDNINKQIKEQFVEDLEQGEIIYDGFISKQVLSQEVSDEIGQEVDNFTITNKILASVIILDYDEFIEQAKQIYQEKLGNNQQIINWDLENIDYSVKEFDAEQKLFTFEVALTADVQGSFNQDEFDKTEIAGFDRKGVEYYFSQYPGVKDVQVDFSPFWVKSVPALPDKIEIVIE